MLEDTFSIRWNMLWNKQLTTIYFLWLLSISYFTTEYRLSRNTEWVASATNFLCWHPFRVQLKYICIESHTSILKSYLLAFKQTELQQFKNLLMFLIHFVQPAHCIGFGLWSQLHLQLQMACMSLWIFSLCGCFLPPTRLSPIAGLQSFAIIITSLYYLNSHMHEIDQDSNPGLLGWISPFYQWANSPLTAALIFFVS